MMTLAAMLLATVAAPAAAAQTTTGATPPTQRDIKPSPFLQCDGDTGHIGAAERIGRLLAVTATAGLSEMGTVHADASKRLKGAAGAAACDVAIGQEGNVERRARLAVARTVHLIEADRNDAALVSAREIATLGQFDQDWGMRHTMGAGALVLQANILARMGRLVEAEDAAMHAGVVAGYDFSVLQRVTPYASLTERMTEDKRQVLAMTARTIPSRIVAVADAMGQTGDWSGASRLIDTSFEAAHSFRDPDKVPNDFNDDVLRSLFGAFTSRPEELRAMAADARRLIADQVAAGDLNQRAPLLAQYDELLCFVDIAVQLREGQTDAARKAFAARGNWLQVPAALRISMVDRLRAAGGPGDGLLADDATTMREAERRVRLAALTHADRTNSLYSIGSTYAADHHYRDIAASVWKIGEKPRFLVRSKSVSAPTFDILDAGVRMYGVQAGEGLLLHAALIAKSRGMDGVAMAPVRTTQTVAGVRFGKIGTPGFPREMTLRADDIIAALAPYIPQPAVAR